MAGFPVKLPTFHGEPGQKGGEENWKAYKNAIELCYVVSDTKPVTDAQRVAHLLVGLTGKAKKFLDLHPELRKKSYAEVDRVFTEKFGKASAKNLLDINKIVQRPGESVLEYVTRLKEAAEILQEDSFSPTIATQEQIENMDEDEIKRLNVFTQDEYNKARSLVNDAFNKLMMPHFLNGLKKEMREVVMQSRPTTFEAALKTAEEYEKYQETFGCINPSGGGNISHLHAHDPSEDNIIEEVAEQLQGLNVKENTSGTSGSHDPRKEQDPRYNNMEMRRCHYCQKIGHLKFQCRLRLSHLRENSGGYTQRYQPYPAEGRRSYNNHTPYNNQRYEDETRDYSSHPSHPSRKRVYLEDPRRSYREDPRPSRNGYSSEERSNSRSPRLQPRMRNMRSASTGRGREFDTRITGEAAREINIDKPMSNWPQPRLSRSNRNQQPMEKERRPPRTRSQGVEREQIVGEINYQYRQKGGQVMRRGQSQGSKNGERRPVNRGSRIPSPRPYVRSAPRR